MGLEIDQMSFDNGNNHHVPIEKFRENSIVASSLQFNLPS
jgi:hypothetical protein